MFGRGLILTISVIIVLGLRGGALQSSMTEDEYDAAMKRIRMTAGDADGHIDARYFPELEESGQALASLFGQVEAFWTARNTEAAAEIARTALTATEAMTAAARRD